MDRELLRAYLATQYDTLLVEAGIGIEDNADGLESVLDAVEQLAALSPGLSPLWLQPLGRYYALDRIVSRLAVNISISISGDSYALQQQFDHAKYLLELARAQVAWIVDPIPPVAAGSPGTVSHFFTPFLTGPEGEGSWS